MIRHRITRLEKAVGSRRPRKVIGITRDGELVRGAFGQSTVAEFRERFGDRGHLVAVICVNPERRPEPVDL